VPYLEGCDPGIACVSEFDYKNKLLITIISNCCNDVWKIKEKILSVLTQT
jgi:hypothetical protein